LRKGKRLRAVGVGIRVETVVVGVIVVGDGVARAPLG
jgi:hypothetical protein